MKIVRFEDLESWKASRELMQIIYMILEKNTLAKEFELKSQFLRAGLSVMNNIAEGFGRFYEKEFIRFLNMSSASCAELRSMGYILIDQKYISEKEFELLKSKIKQTQRLINGLIRYLKNR